MPQGRTATGKAAGGLRGIDDRAKAMQHGGPDVAVPGRLVAMVTALLVLAAGFVATSFVATSARAQAPTADQIRQLQSLSPEQKRALAEQYGLLDGLEGDGVAPDQSQGQPSGQSTGQPGSSRAGTPNGLQPGTPNALGVPGATAGFDRQLAKALEPPTIQPGDTVLLDLKPEPAADLEQPAVAGIDVLLKRALAANPYRLDHLGQLRIPGVRNPIALAGLTTKEATARLNLEPELNGLKVGLTLLGLAPMGRDALKPFGHELFNTVPGAFSPAGDFPVPADYTIGPGDFIKVQLIGNKNASYQLPVGRTGEINLPDIGPVSVAGMPFDELQKLIETTVSEQMVGTRAVVSLGQLRSIRVLVTGEALHPGSYTIGGLSTMSNALILSGGPTLVGSLRNVQLKRGGRTVSTLDLYDLLLRGDAQHDARLQSGDVLFIPPVGHTAGITGEILRPAIYEYKGAATVADLVGLAGGLTPEAAPGRATIERIDARAGRRLIDVDLTTSSGRGIRLQTGDLLKIEAVRPTMADAVTLSGDVYRPGATQFRAGSRLTDIIHSVDDLKPHADLNYVLIRREVPPDRHVAVLSADLEAAWRNPASAANVALSPRDQIIVFDTEGSRVAQLEPILADLRRQGTRENPTQIVNIDGSVRMPGAYPLESGMRIADLVRAGGSLGEAAFGAEAELARYEVVNGQARRTEVREVDLKAALAGDPGANLLLQPFDLLTIKQVPEWTRRESVNLVGEVRFPGRYAIRRGETLEGLLQRAGGLTDLAFPEGVVFTRKSLKEREAAQIQELADRLERDLTALAVQTSQAPSGQNSAQSLAVGQSLLASLRNTKPVGRLAIDLPRILKAPVGSSADILLKDDDQLIVPRRSQEVTVLGEVQSATSHLYEPGLDREDYVNLSGGTTKKADKGRIYVVRANGQVVASSGSHWFSHGNQQIHPGDTIVVPVDTERLPPLPLWTSVTTIIYNLAVAVAAVNSF